MFFTNAYINAEKFLWISVWLCYYRPLTAKSPVLVAKPIQSEQNFNVGHLPSEVNEFVGPARSEAHSRSWAQSIQRPPITRDTRLDAPAPAALRAAGFRGKFGRLIQCSTLSKIGATSKPGTIHMRLGLLINLLVDSKVHSHNGSFHNESPWQCWHYDARTQTQGILIKPQLAWTPSFDRDACCAREVILTVTEPKFGLNHRKVALCNFWPNYTVYYTNWYFCYKPLILLIFWRAWLSVICRSLVRVQVGEPTNSRAYVIFDVSPFSFSSAV
jgi:hypothetical protein